MSSVGGGGSSEELWKKLSILADPQALQQRIESLREREQAHDTAAQTAALAKADLEAAQKQLDESRATVLAAHNDLSSREETVAAQLQAINERDAEIKQRETSVGQRESAVGEVEQKALVAVQEKQTELDDREAAIALTEADLKNRHQNVAALQSEYASKIESLRALVK